MPCANCREDLVSKGEDEKEDGEFKVDSGEEGEDQKFIPVAEALKTVFEGTLKRNKKQISATSKIKMCPGCLNGLADLHRTYGKFMGLTKEGSYIQQLLNCSVLWLFGRSSGSTFGDLDEDYSPLVEVKMEVEEDGDGVKIKEEVDPDQDSQDPDFICNYADNVIYESADEDFPFLRSTRRTTAKGFGLRLRGKRALVSAKPKSKTTRANESKRRRAAVKAALKPKVSKSRVKLPKIEKESKPKKRVPRLRKTETEGTECHGDDKPFKCTEDGCKKSFNDGKLYRRHLKFKHGNASSEELADRTCNMCPTPKVFGLPSQLRYHVEAVHATETPFDCPKCDRKFPTKNRLSIHNLMKHSAKNPPKEKEPIFCPHKCTEEPFKTKVGLKLHLKSIHNETLSYTCVTCGKTFQRGTRYRRHLKYKHGEGLTEQDLEGRTCGVCARVFETPSQLRYHSQSVHVTEKPFECDECDRKFPTKNYLSIHKLTRHERGSVRHPCEQCGKTYCSKPALQEHVDAVHLRKKEIVCDVCGKKFARQNGLNRHMEVHDPTRERTFQCLQCLQYFISEKTLKTHMKVHSGVKDQLCPQCGDAFLHSASLRRHLHAKHGIVATEGVDSCGGHTCEQCGKTFKLKEYLRQHLRSITHGGKGHTAQRKRQSGSGYDDSNADSPPPTVRRNKKPKVLPPPTTVSLTLPQTRIDLSTVHPHPNIFWTHNSLIPGHTHYY